MPYIAILVGVSYELKLIDHKVGGVLYQAELIRGDKSIHVLRLFQVVL